MRVLICAGVQRTETLSCCRPGSEAKDSSKAHIGPLCSKSEVLREYRKSFNKPEKYQALRLEIEGDKRDLMEEIAKQVFYIKDVLVSLKETQT